MATPEVFAEEMIQLGLTAARNAFKAVGTAFVVMATDVITETPADVGTAKSNWLPSIGAPIEGTTIPAYMPGTKGSTGPANAEAAIGVAEGIARAYMALSEGGHDLGSSLYLSNNLPYIDKLNGGSSTQAPALFVERAVASGVAAAEGVRLLD